MQKPLEVISHIFPLQLVNLNIGPLIGDRFIIIIKIIIIIIIWRATSFDDVIVVVIVDVITVEVGIRLMAYKISSNQTSDLWLLYSFSRIKSYLSHTDITFHR